MRIAARISALLGSAALLGLVGCTSVYTGADYNPSLAPNGYRFPERVGDAAVRGQALWRQDGGGLITCAGDEVYMLPVSEYAQHQLWQLKYGDGLDLSRQPGFHKQLCDARGNFDFRDLGAGDWYVVSRFVWYDNDQPQGGWLVTTVDLAPGEHERVIINERNLYSPWGGRTLLDDRLLPPPDYQNPDYPWPAASDSTYGSAPSKTPSAPPAGSPVTSPPSTTPPQGTASTPPETPSAPTPPASSPATTPPQDNASTPPPVSIPPAEIQPPQDTASTPPAEAPPAETPPESGSVSSPSQDSASTSPPDTAATDATPPDASVPDQAEPATPPQEVVSTPAVEPNPLPESVPAEPVTPPADINSPPEKATVEPDGSTPTGSMPSAGPAATPEAEAPVASTEPAPVAEPEAPASSTEPIKTEATPPEPTAAPATELPAQPAAPAATEPVAAAAPEPPAVADTHPHSLGATETIPVPEPAAQP